MPASARDFLTSALSALSDIQNELDKRPALMSDPNVVKALSELDDLAHETSGDIQDMED